MRAESFPRSADLRKLIIPIQKKMTEYNIAPEQECNDEQHSKQLLALSSISQCFKSDNNHQL